MGLFLFIIGGQLHAQKLYAFNPESNNSYAHGTWCVHADALKVAVN